MGPWFIRDVSHPFRPGCSYETLRELIKRGKVTRNTILRGPLTRQFWSFAGRTPSVANLLGVCHNCASEVDPDEFSCAACGAAFSPDTDRQHLGLAPIHLLPGQAAPEIIAAAAATQAGRPLPARAAGGPRVEDEPPAPARERRRLSGAMIAAGAVVLAVAAGCVWLVVWALQSPVPEVPPPPPGPVARQPESPPTGGAEPPAPGAPALEPAPETPPEETPAAAPEAAGLGAPAADPAPPTAEEELRAAFESEGYTAESFRAMLAALHSAARISRQEVDAWEDLVRKREEAARLRNLP